MRLHPARAVGLLRAPWIPGWSKDPLWRRARAVPSLDLRFADNKSLVDATTGAQLVTFTRASSATYVDSQGVIRTATTNLLLRSEEFETTWTRVNVAAFGSGSVANADISPNGSLTADKIVADATNGQHRLDQTLTSAAGPQVFSVYVKAAGYTFAGLRIGLLGAAFDLTSGSTSGVVSATSASIVAVGNGWYRCSIYVASASANDIARINITQSGIISASFSGNGTDGLLLWGAQLEQSSTVGEYVPTTSSINSAPRFDHNPTTGESLGLLVEESRTNLLLRSEEFDNASWAKARCSITQNTIAAPNGSVTADLLIEDTSLNTHRLLATAATVAANSTVTFSVYFKSKERTQIQLYIDEVTGAGGASFSALYSASGVSGTLATGAAAYTSGSVQALGDGWYRAVITGTLNGGYTSYRCSLFPAVSGSTSYQGDGTSGIYLWGAQLEAGAFPTSYIRSDASAATRAADTCSLGGSNFSSWYNQSQGTVFTETIPRQFSQAFGVLSLDDGTISERFQTRYSTTGAGALVASDGGTVQANFATLNTATTQTRSRLATSYAVNSFNACLDGGQIASDTSGTLPTPTQGVIGNAVGANYANAPISRIIFWPARLGNEVLQRLTQ